ncbi:MAG: helix-turn-helix domain-containing protein, partial [Candidatus Thiodiazotropha sp.]
QPGQPSLEQMVDQLLDQDVPLALLENKLLDRAMNRSKGNLSFAGRMLGLTRPQMAYRLKKYGAR